MEALESMRRPTTLTWRFGGPLGAVQGPWGVPEGGAVRAESTAIDKSNILLGVPGQLAGGLDSKKPWATLTG